MCRAEARKGRHQHQVQCGKKGRSDIPDTSADALKLLEQIGWPLLKVLVEELRHLRVGFVVPRQRLAHQAVDVVDVGALDALDEHF